MFDIPNWPSEPPKWSGDLLQLLINDHYTETSMVVNLEQIVEKSEAFHLDFPINSVKCENISIYVSKEILERHINSVYPVIHEMTLYLYASFLLFKRKFGNNLEREFYKNVSLLDLIDRLISKRAVSFLGESDRYLLIDGTKGFGKWGSIGTDRQTDKLKLTDCLSYDEIKLSALLSISSSTQFLNNGNRYNRGVKNTQNVESEGIIIGLIGTRFEKTNVMEYQEVIVSKTQNTEENGYGTQFVPTLHSIFSGFYQEACLTYNQALNQQRLERNRYNLLNNQELFDNNMYCKRIALSIDTLLLEANERAIQKKTSAFVHVVGIGLGVWKISPHQKALFLDTFGKRIQKLGVKIKAVSDIVFAYFGENDTCDGFHDEDIINIRNHPNNGIKIYFKKREPHTKLTGVDAGKLLVVSYAWDGNALPGNEFWIGSLTASGDPAAACSTQISEIHNPHINLQVRSNNLRVVTLDGLVTYKKYCQVLKQK